MNGKHLDIEIGVFDLMKSSIMLLDCTSMSCMNLFIFLWLFIYFFCIFFLAESGTSSPWQREKSIFVR